jgi:hypothetical protein
MAPALRCLPPLALVALLGLGCAGLSSAPQGSSYAFFAAPEPESDPWYAKVEDWQQREQNHRPHTGLADSATIRAKPDSGLLRVRMGRWEAEERLAMARRLATWSQAEARRHYRFDPPQNVVDDPWPTTKDLLDTDGDDCDGLDLIAYELMREFGFPPDQLYRAIVRRDRDRANHMVTLWFDNPEDPDAVVRQPGRPLGGGCHGRRDHEGAPLLGPPRLDPHGDLQRAGAVHAGAARTPGRRRPRRRPASLGVGARRSQRRFPPEIPE